MAKSSIVRMYKNVKLGKNGCHEFIGCRTKDGYGRILSERKVILTHRLSYESIHGKIPQNMCVCHDCDNPCCVNPCHLYLGTHDDNMRDKAYKKRVTNTVGEINPNAILKQSQVLEIKKKLSLGYTSKQLAKEFDVSYNSVLKIKTGKTWLHVKV